MMMSKCISRRERQYCQVFIVLIFPLIMFILGYFLSGAILNFQSDALKAAGGAAGLFLGFILSFIYNMLRKNQSLPVITRKL